MLREKGHRVLFDHPCLHTKKRVAKNSKSQRVTNLNLIVVIVGWWKKHKTWLCYLYSQGLSKKDDEKLLWKGSSQAGLSSFIETHLKQSIERAISGCKKEERKNITYRFSFLLIGVVFIHANFSLFLDEDKITGESEYLEKYFFYFSKNHLKFNRFFLNLINFKSF